MVTGTYMLSSIGGVEERDQYSDKKWIILL